MELTELEKQVMEAGRKTNFGDCLVEPQWSFAVADAARMDYKVYRGVVASLVKKGLANICDNEGRGRNRFDDMVFSYTEEGKKLMTLWELYGEFIEMYNLKNLI